MFAEHKGGRELTDGGNMYPLLFIVLVLLPVSSAKCISKNSQVFCKGNISNRSVMLEWSNVNRINFDFVYLDNPNSQLNLTLLPDLRIVIVTRSPVVTCDKIIVNSNVAVIIDDTACELEKTETTTSAMENITDIPSRRIPKIETLRPYNHSTTTLPPGELTTTLPGHQSLTAPDQADPVDIDGLIEKIIILNAAILASVVILMSITCMYFTIKYCFCNHTKRKLPKTTKREKLDESLKIPMNKIPNVETISFESVELWTKRD
ncbi:uncharacterized protein [Argopecten irradians]|uniref:uncharacterized protein n=1 Tax=Argopecten irradians TaxID=31199 RepID=UPI0037210A08